MSNNARRVRHAISLSIMQQFQRRPPWEKKWARRLDLRLVAACKMLIKAKMIRYSQSHNGESNLWRESLAVPWKMQFACWKLATWKGSRKCVVADTVQCIQKCCLWLPDAIAWPLRDGYLVLLGPTWAAIWGLVDVLTALRQSRGSHFHGLLDCYAAKVVFTWVTSVMKNVRDVTAWLR